MDSFHLPRTMSLVDMNTSCAIRDGIERDITIPADKSKHRFFLQLPRHDFILPSLTRFDQDFRKFLLSVLVDYNLMHEMEDAKCVNWCTILPKFLPLQTLGDGNCLMHAASLSMWAVQDRRLTLRKSVYQVLIEDETEIFRKRWQFEQEKRLEGQNGSPVDCSNEQWDEDWQKTVELASTTKNESRILNSLEEIHIFALANTLRRPILVLCDDVHRGNFDESLADVNLGGIYLPLLWDSVDCIKSPIVIGYHQGHFTALVTTEDGSITGEDMFQPQRNKYAIPLVKYDESPMQLHFLLPDEQQSSDRLLREYLNCSKIKQYSNGLTRTILVASMQSQEPEPHLDQMFKTYFEALQDIYLEKLAEKQVALSGHNSQPHHSAYNQPYNMQYNAMKNLSQTAAHCCNAHKRCKNAVCGNYTSANSSDYCSQCRKTKPPLCTSPGCTYSANPDYEGLCSTCFMRYRAILEQGAEVATPSAPPSNCCNSSNCSKEAGLHFGGKCHDCYINDIRHGSFANIANAPSPGSIPNTEMQAEDKFGLVGPSNQAFSRQNSRLFCFNQSCSNPLPNSTQVYCDTCFAALAPRNVARNEICRISGCNDVAVTYHGQLCFHHYHESLKNYHQKNQHTPQAGMKCITTGCTFFGIQDHNYLCSRCHAKALQAQYDLEKMDAEQSRAQECSTNSSFGQPKHDTSRKPFYYEAISQPNTSSSAPPSPNRKRKPSRNTAPCVTKGCPYFGTDEKQGLCDICFRKEELLLYQGECVPNRHASLP